MKKKTRDISPPATAEKVVKAVKITENDAPQGSWRPTFTPLLPPFAAFAVFFPLWVLPGVFYVSPEAL